MKKYLLCIVFAAFCQISYGQDITRLLKTVSENENVEKIKLEGSLINLGKMVGGVGNMPVVRGIESMEIYTLSNCNSKLKEIFLNVYNEGKEINGYETLIFAKNKKDGIRIMFKKEKDKINEIIFLCMDVKDPVIMKFSGKIKESDLSELVNEYDNN